MDGNLIFQQDELGKIATEQRLINAGLSHDAAIDIANNCSEETATEVAETLELLNDAQQKEDGIFIPADSRVADYFWKKVDARISDPNTPETNHSEVIIYLINKL